MALGVYVDTSVFIDFFRKKPVPEFERLLLNNAIILSPLVRLELIQGVRASEVARLDSVLGGLRAGSIDTSVVETAETLLKKVRGKGLTLGIADLLIAAESALARYPVYSFDKVFQQLENLGAVKLFHPRRH